MHLNSELEVPIECPTCGGLLPLARSLSHLSYHCQDCGTKFNVLTIEEFVDRMLTWSDKQFLEKLGVQC